MQNVCECVSVCARGEEVMPAAAAAAAAASLCTSETPADVVEPGCGWMLWKGQEAGL